MKISFFGHSEFLLEMTNISGKNIRILFDSWLTDYAYGDFLARNPRLNFDFAALPRLDAIYLTHPHCDHFDPYSLVEIFKLQRPAIFIPETNEYLKALLHEMLDDPEIFVFRHGEKSRLFGIHFQAWSFAHPYRTNEDDVMMLMLHNQTECLFYEADAAVPETVDAWSTIYRAFCEYDFHTRLYMATRNELEALFTAYDVTEPEERSLRLDQYRTLRSEEAEWEFFRFSEVEELPGNLYALPGMNRILVGQGIVYPPETDDRYLKLSRPFGLESVAALETKMAELAGTGLQVHAAQPGKSFLVERGQVSVAGTTPGMQRAIFYDLSFDSSLRLEPSTLAGPLFDEHRDVEKQEEMILSLLNNRFLPFLASDLQEGLKWLLSNRSRSTYTIAVEYGHDRSDHRVVYYQVSFEKPDRFVSTTRTASPPDEVYYANDLEDFLEGRQDLFSNSLASFGEDTSRRLWNMLGLPFMNTESVEKKLRLHFTRARRGETVADWVLPVVRNVEQRKIKNQ